MAGAGRPPTSCGAAEVEVVGGRPAPAMTQRALFLAMRAAPKQSPPRRAAAGSSGRRLLRRCAPRKKPRNKVLPLPQGADLYPQVCTGQCWLLGHEDTHCGGVRRVARSGILARGRRIWRTKPWKNGIFSVSATVCGCLGRVASTLRRRNRPHRSVSRATCGQRSALKGRGSALPPGGAAVSSRVDRPPPAGAQLAMTMTGPPR